MTHYQAYIGGYLVIHVKQREVMIGGNFCSEGCKPKGKAGEFCNKCGTKITYNPNCNPVVTWPSPEDMVGGQDNWGRFEDCFWIPSYVNDESNFGSGVYVCLTNTKYNNLENHYWKDNTMPINSEVIGEDMGEFAYKFGETIAWLRTLEDVESVDVYWGMVPYAH